jgi:hypothetical protein
MTTSDQLKITAVLKLRVLLNTGFPLCNRSSCNYNIGLKQRVFGLCPSSVFQ